MALGSPCVSVYVPVPPPAAPSAPGGPAGRGAPLPAVVGDPVVWRRLAAVRDAVGSDAGALGMVRSEMSTVEDSLWDEADDLGADPAAWHSFGARATVGIRGALDRLAAVGLGLSGREAEGGR